MSSLPFHPLSSSKKGNFISLSKFIFKYFPSLIRFEKRKNFNPGKEKREGGKLPEIRCL